MSEGTRPEDSWLRRWTLAHPRQVQAFILLLALLVGSLAFLWNRSFSEQKQVELLQTDAQRRSVELLSQTLNGNLMGSVSLLGVIHSAIKQEALGSTAPNDLAVRVVLGLLGGSYKANGIFVVGEDGVVKSSWNRDGSSSTGTDVRFRPYYQLAMKAKQSVYAAVSVSNGERSLYFSAPVYSEMALGNSGIGAVVARNDMSRVEEVLKASADIALLLTPQGVVFAASDPRWIGQVAGELSEQRLQEIRSRKQMGKMFDTQVPVTLPLSLGQGIQTLQGERLGLASAAVEWNDPGGPWTLVLANQLQRDGWSRTALAVGIGGFVLALMFLYLLLWLIRSQWRQQGVARELAVNLAIQQEQVHMRQSLGDLGTQLQRCDSLQQLASTYLSEMHLRVGSLQGVVFGAGNGDGDGNELPCLAGFATPEGPLEPLHSGQGLLGQALQERRLRWLGVDEAAQWTLRSGLGSTSAVAAVVAPLVTNDQVLGAVELVFARAITPLQMQWVEESIALLALNLAVQQRSRQAASTLEKDPTP